MNKIMRISNRGLIIQILFFASLSLNAQVPIEENSGAASHHDSLQLESATPIHPEQPSAEKFNAGKLIIEHISDSHDWHIAGHFAVPLPIIIYSKERGLDIFISSKFEHGHKTYKGYMLENNHIKAVNELETMDAHEANVNSILTENLWDISITKNVTAMFVSIFIMLWVFISVAKAYVKNTGKAPKGLQSLIEPLIIFVRDDIAKSAIGEKKFKKYLPFLLTVFFFIWINNLLGLISFAPFGANVTGNVAIGLTLAVIVFVITIVSANKNYWRHIIAMPGVPIGVLVLLTPIEIFGMFLKPFVLMIRLFANMLAGHIIALSFFSLIFIFAEMNVGLGFGVSILSIAFTVFMGMLELLVAFLQAYVFTLLAAMYFGSAVEEHHHEEVH